MGIAAVNSASLSGGTPATLAVATLGQIGFTLALQREAKAEDWRVVTAKGEARAASVSWDARAHNEGTAVTSIGGPSMSRVIGPYWGCRRFIGCKLPALAKKYRGVLPGWKWRT